MTKPYFMIVYSGKKMTSLVNSAKKTMRVIDAVKRRKGEYWFLILSEKKPFIVGESTGSTKMDSLP